MCIASYAVSSDSWTNLVERERSVTSTPYTAMSLFPSALAIADSTSAVETFSPFHLPAVVTVSDSEDQNASQTTLRSSRART